MQTPNTSKTVSLNHMEMYVEVRGEGKPLLLLHGFTGIGSDWNLIFPLPPKGYRLIIPDLRGHGSSTNPSGQFTHRQAASDVFGLLDHLGVGTFRAMGMSTGANVLLHMATQQPEKIEAMVLVSGGHYFPEQARAIMARFKTDGLTDKEWQALRKRHKHGDEQIRALYRQANVFAESHDDMNLTPQSLGGITAKTLIVHGDRDPFFPLEIPLEQYRSIPGSALWIVPNNGHVPIFGEMAPNFARASIRFLNSKSRQG
jgi:pimeloyl-ACP methyl ester carboxylesterase